MKMRTRAELRFRTKVDEERWLSLEATFDGNTMDECQERALEYAKDIKYCFYIYLWDEKDDRICLECVKSPSDAVWKAWRSPKMEEVNK